VTGEPPRSEDGAVRLDDLLRALQAADDRGREDAACTLRDLVLGGGDETRWREALRAALHDPDPTVRFYAAEGLGRVGDPAIFAAARDPAAPIRREAVALVGALFGVERRAWAEELAAEVDLRLAPPEVSLEDALAVLRSALTDSDFDVREAGFHALGGLGALARAAVPDLMAALDDDDVAARALAADALGHLGAEARAALPLLRRMAADDAEERDVRYAAAEAIAAIEGGPAE
jgi:HEAT repeat protein